MKPQDIKRIDEPKLTPAEKLYLPAVVKGMAVTLRHLLSIRSRRTVQYPEQKRPLLADNYRGMHRLNRDQQGRVACVACMLCQTICPAHCISIEAAEAPWPDREKYPVRFDIDELRCIFCGMCQQACPVNAIELTPVFDIVGTSREEMTFDKEKLLLMYDLTKDIKPHRPPQIVGYGDQHAQTETRPPAETATQGQEK